MNSIRVFFVVIMSLYILYSMDVFIYFVCILRCYFMFIGAYGVSVDDYHGREIEIVFKIMLKVEHI